jgi:hypothetical protein
MGARKAWSGKRIVLQRIVQRQTILGGLALGLLLLQRLMIPLLNRIRLRLRSSVGLAWLLRRPHRMDQRLTLRVPALLLHRVPGHAHAHGRSIHRTTH